MKKFLFFITMVMMLSINSFSYASNVCCNQKMQCTRCSKACDKTSCMDYCKKSCKNSEQCKKACKV